MSGRLLRYYRDQLDLNSTVVPDSFSGNSAWFKSKQKQQGQQENMVHKY